VTSFDNSITTLNQLNNCDNLKPCDNYTNDPRHSIIFDNSTHPTPHAEKLAKESHREFAEIFRNRDPDGIPSQRERSKEQLTKITFFII